MLTGAKYQDQRLRKHTDKAELILAIVKEEAMALDAALEMGNRTSRVQVNVSYTDQNGVMYHATRIVKMRVKREEA